MSDILPAGIFQEAIESGFDSVWIVALPGFELLYANRRTTEEMLGYPVENFHADPLFWHSLVVEDDRHIAEQANAKCLAFDMSEAVYRMIASTGRIVWVQARLRLVRDSSGTPIRIVGTTMDITRRKEAEQVLVYSSKMASLGEMAGGVAHEINNPLAIIHGKASQLRELLESGRIEPQALRDGLEKIEVTAERIANIVRGLKSFSRESEPDLMESVPISEIIENTVAFCQERFRNHLIELRLPDRMELMCRCRAPQISQVILNLLMNAFDAVEKLPRRWVELAVEAHEGGIRITVSDSGPPIPEPVRIRMMEPFFTTKETGRGTGLGLSISKGIVESHRGRFYFDPTGPVTRFVVELPAV